MEKLKVAVFSPNDPRPWVRKLNLGLMLKHETLLISALRKQGVEVVRGGEGYPRENQIAWNTKLVREQIQKLSRTNPEVLIINEGSWTFPYDSRDAAQIFNSTVNCINGTVSPSARILIFAYKDTKVPGMVAGMAAAGAFKRIGIPYQLVYGKIDVDPKTVNTVMDVIRFYHRTGLATKRINTVIQNLKSQKYLACGGMSLKMCTTTADVDQWAKMFGITYEALDQSELTRRAKDMVVWSGKPATGKIKLIKDKRVQSAVNFLYKGKHGNFDFTRPSLKSIDKFIYQLAYYYAAVDLFTEYGITFAGIKCQDELSATECTQCIAAAYLNNDIGPDGKPKPVIPVACENDMDSALTQLWLFLLSHQPSGFGDFRDVENGILAIVNCGQHPPYFFGRPEDKPVAKLNATEYLGQEYFYHAGGSAVRGRTPGGELMTIARLGRENLRYQLVATVMETVNVNPEDHRKYDFSWPIIWGKIPIPDELMINTWPCNHLGFTYGDYTPDLVELCNQLGVGYRIFDRKGREYFRPS